MKKPNQLQQHSDRPAASSGVSVEKGELSRRSFLGSIGLGGLVIGFLGQTWMYLRSLFPNVSYESPRRFKLGHPDTIPEGATFVPKQRVFIFREGNKFNSISAICTHLGCTVNQVMLDEPKVVKAHGENLTEAWEFHCPCHGSKFYGDGTVYAGPAPKDLPTFRLSVAPDDGQIVVDLGDAVEKKWRLFV